MGYADQSHHGDLCTGDPGLADGPARRHSQSLVPIIRILLYPAGVWIIGWIFGAGAADDPALIVENNRFTAARSQVAGQKIFVRHGVIVSLLQIFD